MMCSPGEYKYIYICAIATYDASPITVRIPNWLSEICNWNTSCASLKTPTGTEGECLKMNGEHQAGHKTMDSNMHHSHSGRRADAVT